MSLRSHKNLKLVGATGAAAALALSVAAAPAIAAPQDLTYTCDVLGATSATLNPGSIPAKMVAGETSKRKMTMVVHLDALQTATAKGFGDSVDGTAVADGKKKTFPFNMKIPTQTIPSSGTMDVNAAGKGTIRPLKAGKWLVKAGDMVATLTLHGATDTTVPLNCVAPTDNTTHFGKITVSKDKTTTAASASYSSKKHAATGTAKVKSHFGLKPTGKVKFTLKKGTKVIKTLKGSVNKKGVAKVSFKNITAKGKYSITDKYAGDSNLKGSSDKATFKV